MPDIIDDPITFITAPRVTVISRPTFSMPYHLPVEYIGPSTSGERLAEFAGRICYMSQKNPAQRTTKDYLDNIKRQGHGSVLEHANYSLLVEGVSRSLTHELVRHRAGFAYSQLSQRYVNEEATQFVVPPAILQTGGVVRAEWENQVLRAREAYRTLADSLFLSYAHILDRTHRRKMAREAARGVLPNATETKIVVTANVRAWRTMLQLRAAEGAEREIRRLAIAIIAIMKAEANAFFNDFEIYTAEDGAAAARTPYHKV